MRSMRFRGFGFTGEVASIASTAMESTIGQLNAAVLAVRGQYNIAASPPPNGGQLLTDATGALSVLQRTMAMAISEGQKSISNWREGAQYVADSLASLARVLGREPEAAMALSALSGELWANYERAVQEASSAAAQEAAAAAEAARVAEQEAAIKAAADADAARAAEAAAQAKAAAQAQAAQAAAQATMSTAPAAPRKKKWLVPALIGAGVLFLTLRRKGAS